MSVYVDRVRARLGYLIMSHMIADTPAELHAMADQIGLQRRWFQAPPKASFPHYDVSQAKRALAIAAGAHDCDRNTFVGHMRQIRTTLAFGALRGAKPEECP